MISWIRGRTNQLLWLIARLGRAGNGHSTGILAFWKGWERLTERRSAARNVRPGTILRYSLETYEGQQVRLRDGTFLRPNDSIIELHFDNRALLRLATSRNWNLWYGVSMLDEDIDALARLAHDGRFNGVVALHGITLYASGAPRFGFEYRPLPRTWKWKWVHYFMVGLFAIYNPHGWQGASRLRANYWPGEIWMSFDDLKNPSVRERRSRSLTDGKPPPTE